eukprot:s1928_g1.t1
MIDAQVPGNSVRQVGVRNFSYCILEPRRWQRCAGKLRLQQRQLVPIKLGQLRRLHMHHQDSSPGCSEL